MRLKLRSSLVASVVGIPSLLTSPALGRRGLSFLEPRFEVLIEDRLEILHNGGPFQGHHQASVNVDGRLRLFPCAGQRDADMRMFGLSGAIDDTSHDGDF